MFYYSVRTTCLCPDTPPTPESPRVSTQGVGGIEGKSREVYQRPGIGRNDRKTRTSDVL